MHDETRPLISASNDVIPTFGSVDLDVTVTIKDGDVNSEILPFNCHRPARHPGYSITPSTPSIADDQEQPSEGARAHDNILTIRSHQHLGVMFTDLQGVPGPVHEAMSLDA